MNKVWQVMLGACWLASGEVGLLGSEYELAGMVTDEDFHAQGPLWRSLTREFVVYANGCQWLIQTTRDLKTNGLFWRGEVGSTNESEFYSSGFAVPSSHRGSAPATNLAAPQPGRPSRFLSEARVSPNRLPVGNGVEHHLWLMLASSCYFARETNDSWPALFLQVGSPEVEQIRMRTVWGLLPGSAQLPALIHFLNDGTHYFYQGGGAIKSERYKPPFDRGFTNATYSVTGVTNVGDLVLPTGFCYQEWWADDRPDGKGLVLRRRVSATITTVAARCSRGDLRPVLPPDAGVSDHRLPMPPSKVRNIACYRAPRPARWLTVAEAKKHYARVQRSGSAPSSLHWWWVFAGAALLPPGVILLQRCWRTR